MTLDHERLDVYRLGLDFLVFAHQVLKTLPRGYSHLSDQLTRASTSIVLNIAEGAGKHSKATSGGTTCLLVGRRPSPQRYWTCCCDWAYSMRAGTSPAKRCWCAKCLC